jgi:hypothetical protein
MSISHRTNRLKLELEPEVTKLYGGRYRIVVRCAAMDGTKAWYNANKAQIFADFGTLYSAQMSIDGIDARTGEAYDDMVLVENKAYPYGQGEEYLVEFKYETLTDSFVKEQEDKVDFDLNGLKRLTRTIIAKDTVAYSSVVGTTTLGSTPTLTLAQSVEDQLEPSEDGFKRIQEVWLESGTLSETLDNVGSQKAKVIETIGADPATPSGYSLASKQESNFEGFQTNRFTFLKDNVVLSESEDNVGSQEAIVKEVFNGTPATPSGYSLASKQESDVDGIPTKRYTFLKDNVVLSESEDKVGSQAAIVKEVFNGTPATPSGYVVASEQESDVDGIPTRRYTFLRDNSIMSESRDRVGSQLAITQEVFGDDPVTPNGYSLASSRESNVDGISTRRFTFLKPSVLSRNISKRSNGKLIIETVEAFNETPTATTSGAVEIGNDVSNVEGIPTRRFTFAKGEGTIRTSTRPGQIPGTIEKTVISYGTEVVPTGELIASSQTEEDGYVQYINTAIQGSNITGTKQTYKDVVQVEVPGEVECTTVSVSSGGESGTIAVPKVVPRKRKTIAATVTVEILTTPTNTASVAYDLGEISCSVTSTNVSLTEGPGSTVTIGTNAVVSDTGFVKNFGASARISTYPGCYLTSASSSGTVSYITSSQPVASGNTITREESTSNRSTECIGTGSTSLTGYLETGVVQRKSRPVLTALNGTTYYEVITWSV